jgi:hypothetical protein
MEGAGVHLRRALGFHGVQKFGAFRELQNGTFLKNR